MVVFCVVSFVLLTSMVLYTVAGYPLLLAWLASRFGKPVQKRFELKTVTVLVPVYNGGAFLHDKLRSILALNYPQELMDILVISDGSTDATADVACSFSDFGVRLLQLPHRGKAEALNTGIAHSSGEILLLTDVRQTFEPDSLRHLIACFADPEVGVVSGDLVVRKGNLEETTVGLYWRYERWIRKQLARLDSTIGATGPFYAMRRDLAVRVPPETLLDDVYLPLAAFLRGYRLFVEEKARAFDYPTNVTTEFRRKVRTLAGNYQIMSQYPALFTFRNRMLFHFLSYKVARLVLPWAVLLLFFTSFGLPRPWSALAVAVHGLFYALAGLDPLVQADSFVRRLSTPARTVTTMLAAAACAVTFFFVPPQRLWKHATPCLAERGGAAEAVHEVVG